MLERLEQQKKLTLNQWRIILTANLGDMLDFFDFFLIGYVLAFILKEWYGQAALMFLILGFETKGRSIEEISAALDQPASTPTPVRAPAV